MGSKISTLPGISHDMLSRYVEMRRKIDLEANTVESLSSVLSLLGNFGDDRIEVDPMAIGHINQIINRSILNIWEILDDYIYVVQAKDELERLNKI